MKNIYLLPTEKESRLFENLLGKLVLTKEYFKNSDILQNRHIYITSSDPIKKGDWMVYINQYLTQTKVLKCDDTSILDILDVDRLDIARKIILSTDPDLKKDGIGFIDDNNFLKWFINNSDINYIDIKKEKIDLSDLGYYDIHYKYHIDYPLTEDQENSLDSHRDFVNKTNSEELNNIMSEFDNLEEEDKTYTFEDIINAFYNGWIYRGESEYTYPKAKKEFIENLKK